MTDVHDRIKAAVEARRARAEAATPGSWSEPEEVADQFDDNGWWIHNGRVGAEEYAVAVALPYNPRAKADALFVAGESPDVVLRGCAEDLKTLGDHGVGYLCEDCGKPMCADDCGHHPCDWISSLARRYDIPLEAP